MRAQPKPPTARPGRKGVAAVIAGVLAAAVALPVVSVPETAQAQAARVEATTRPDFGLLLDPPPQRRRPSTRRTWRDHHRDWDRDRFRPRPEWSADIALVDCARDTHPFALQAAVAHLAPGGMLVIRSSGQTCTGWLDIDKPLTIVGDQGVDLETYSPSTPATLRAPDGLPCITVARGVRVQLRDIVLEAPNSGDASCVVTYEGEIVMNRTVIRYGGDESAVFADGGLIDIRSSLVLADTIAAAITGYGAQVTAHDVSIQGANIGVEITPGGSQPSRLSRMTLLAGADAEGYGPRTMGVLVRGAREIGRVSIVDSTICGYSEGVANEGALLQLDGSFICGARKGVVLYSGEVQVSRSQIGATDYGLIAAGGLARVTGNGFYGVDQVYVQERGASVDSNDNVVFSRAVCRPRREEIRGNWRGGGRRYRWLPASGDGWTCGYGQDNRRFWEMCERLMGREYVDYGYPWPDYYRANGSSVGFYDETDRFWESDDHWRRESRRR